MELFKQKCLLGVATIALALPAMTLNAAADPQLDAVLQRLDKLEKENAKLKSDIKKIETKADKPAQAQTGVVPAKAGAPAGADRGFVQVNLQGSSYGALNAPVSYKDGAPEEDDWFFRHKPGSGLTFQTPNGEITAYGRLDVAIQDTTPGTGGLVCTPPSCGTVNRPVGNMGWLPAIGSPTSYVGIRGEQRIGDWSFKDGPGDSSLKFIYQVETAITLSAQSGTKETNNAESNVVSGAISSRNSWIGFASDDWGSIKAGKTSAPYENSTRMMNPFAGMLGTMGVIMGNTGGDNRDEFATMLDHSIWYESPYWKVANGTFSFAALWSPGQNRASNSDNIALGESDCTGGNTPQSGGFATCSDGSFSDAYSASATYQTKINEVGLLVTAAYELHKNVNRQSDILGIYSATPVDGVFITPTGLPIGGNAMTLYNQDIADESAAKVGIQVSLPTHTTISGIYESMHRYVAEDLEFQNERTRNGTWLAISQDLSDKQNIAFGWGHAFKTPGDPCQHNDCTLTTLDTLGAYAPNDNQADLLTAAYSYKFSSGLTWYIDYAATINGPSAHYDLGQGSGIVTDCHDASSAIGGVGAPLPTTSTGGGNSNPHCWTGGLVQGIQTGVRYNF